MTRANRDQNGMFERRKITPFTKLKLLFEVAGEIVMSGELNRRTKRRVGLDKDFAAYFAPSGAAGDLGEKLKRSFARSKIGEMQRQIGIDDPHESDIREVQSFCDH